MAPKTRWITAVIREAARSEPRMPWTRGDTRAAAISRRRAAGKAEPRVRMAGG